MNLKELNIPTEYDHKRDIVLMRVDDLPKIIEKLIADIPEDEKVKNYMRIVKQQLKAKWL
jgi:hypothetical protein